VGQDFAGLQRLGELVVSGISEQLLAALCLYPQEAKAMSSSS